MKLFTLFLFLVSIASASSSFASVKCQAIKKMDVKGATVQKGIRVRVFKEIGSEMDLPESQKKHHEVILEEEIFTSLQNPYQQIAWQSYAMDECAKITADQYCERYFTKPDGQKVKHTSYIRLMSKKSGFIDKFYFYMIGSPYRNCEKQMAENVIQSILY